MPFIRLKTCCIGSPAVVLGDGFTLTNHLVVGEGECVTLRDGRRERADVVHLDRRRDLALLRMADTARMHVK